MRRCFPISPPHWKGLPWPWGQGRRGPGAPGATAICPAGCHHALPAPDMPRRGKAQSPDSEEEEGRLLPSCCPASPSPWCPAEPAPKPPWWLGLCAGGGQEQQRAGSVLRLRAPVRAFFPWAGFHVLPRGKQGGKDASPSQVSSWPLPRCVVFWEEAVAGLYTVLPPAFSQAVAGLASVQRL